MKSQKEDDEMPWKDNTVEMNREDFVKRYLQQEKSMSALCREYGISRPTGYKWLERYEQEQNLSNRSRTPLRTPTKTSPETEKLILNYRAAHPAIGAVKIKRILKNKGYKDIPCDRTINTILKRNGCITKEASEAATPYQRFEKTYPNEMWQADFKGHFLMKNDERCHPLNIIDDHSRFNLCADALPNETFEAVEPCVMRLFDNYGLPFSFLCDNGNPWGTPKATGYCVFEVMLMDLGILPLHGRPRHPQTQGKEESFNHSMKRELLKHIEITDFSHAQQAFDEYRDFYNNERPHHALNLEVPASRYKKSELRLPDKIEEWEYPQGYELRRVDGHGYFKYQRQSYYLSEAFGGKIIAVRESFVPNSISLFYRQFRIGRIDVDRRVYTLKAAYLIEGDPRDAPSAPTEN